METFRWAALQAPGWMEAILVCRLLCALEGKVQVVGLLAQTAARNSCREKGPGSWLKCGCVGILN